MIFIGLLMLSTLAVAASAAFFSVYGLAQIFSAAFIPVIIMGAALEAGKLVAASYLYRYWWITPKLIKTYLTVAVVTLMLITSLGIFGFLTAAYQTDSIDLKQQQERVVLLEDQKRLYVERLGGINQQIEAVQADYITKRMELIRTFEPEKQAILNSLKDVDEELLSLKSNILTTEAKIGPIIYVAEVLEENPDKATFWFVLIIIGVFDPLAVSLTLATNIVLRQRDENRKGKNILESPERLPEMSIETTKAVVPPPTPKPSETLPEVTEELPETLPEVTEKHLVNEKSKSPVIHERIVVTSDNGDLVEQMNSIKQLIEQSSNTEEIKYLKESLDALNLKVKKDNLRRSIQRTII